MADNNEGSTDFVNILLLGERGIGKSTLINAFANYARFETLKDAEDAADFECLIRTQIIGSTSDGEPKILESMSSNKAVHELGIFKTQDVTAYEILYKGKVMRLIDTPGITSTKIEDSASCAMILDFIATLKHVHGVCVIIKPDLSRITPDFMYSLLMYITKLGRSVAGNILFLFTRTRRSNYMALDSITCIKPVLDEVDAKQQLLIPLRYRKAERKNCFCFENEGFNYLVARAQNVHVNTSRTCLEESWTVSRNAMSALMDYIAGDSAHPPLEPYILPDIELISNTRLLIFEMMTPLMDLADIIITDIDLHNMHNMHNMKLKSSGKNLTESDVSMLSITKELELAPLEKAVASCIKCRTDCPLEDIIEESTICGNRKINILDTCKMCYCESTIHLLRYYRTRKNQTPLERYTKVAYQAYVNEFDDIMQCLAYFADYLSQHASKNIKDAYYEYLRYKIDMRIGARDKPALLRCYKLLLKHYDDAKQKNAIRSICLTPEQIISYIEDLKKNAITGAKLIELHKLRHHKQEENISMPMEVDQEIEQISVSPCPSPKPNLELEPIISSITPRTPSPKIPQNSYHEKKQAIIKLLEEDNLKSALKLLKKLNTEIEGVTDEAYTEQPEVDSAEEVTFHDALQDFDSNLIDTLPTNRLSPSPNNGNYYRHNFPQTVQEMKNVPGEQLHYGSPVAPACYYQGPHVNNYGSYSNLPYTGTGQAHNQFPQQTHVISPTGGFAGTVSPFPQASVNVSQREQCCTNPSLYPNLPPLIDREYHNVSGNSSKINTAVARTHILNSAGISTIQSHTVSYAQITAKPTRPGGPQRARTVQPSHEQQQLCERHPNLYVKESDKKGKNKKEVKNKSIFKQFISSFK